MAGVLGHTPNSFPRASLGMCRGSARADTFLARHRPLEGLGVPLHGDALARLLHEGAEELVAALLAQGADEGHLLLLEGGGVERLLLEDADDRPASGDADGIRKRLVRQGVGGFVEGGAAAEVTHGLAARNEARRLLADEPLRGRRLLEARARRPRLDLGRLDPRGLERLLLLQVRPDAVLNLLEVGGAGGLDVLPGRERVPGGERER